MRRESLLRIFRCVWQSMESTGEADAIDGHEYRRIYRAWVAAGKPPRIAVFIRRCANIGPVAPGEEATSE